MSWVNDREIKVPVLPPELKVRYAGAPYKQG